MRVPVLFPTLTSEARSNFHLDAGAAMLFAVFAGSTLPFLSAILARMGASELAVGIVAAAPFAGFSLTAYWGYRLEDRRRIPYIVLPTAAGRLLFLALAFTQRPWTFTALVIGYYLFVSISFPAYTALLAEIYPASHRGRLMGMVRVLLGLTQILITVTAGWVLDTQGRPQAFLPAVAAGLGACLVISRIKERPASAVPRNPSFSFSRLFSAVREQPTLGRFLLAAGLLGAGSLLAIPGYVLYQVQELGLDNRAIGLVSVAWCLGWFLSYPFWGWLADRKHPLRILLLSSFLYLFPPLIYALGAPYYAVITAGVFIGVADSANEMGWTNYLIKMSRERISSYSGIYLSLVGLRGTFAPPLGAWLYREAGPGWLFLTAAALVMSGITAFYLCNRSELKPARSPALQDLPHGA